MTDSNLTPQDAHFITDWLDSANAQLPAVERHIWLVRILDWVREGEPVAHVQYLLHLLQADRERRDKAVQLLAACWRDVDVTALLADYGFAANASFVDELGDRLRRRLLPLTPETSDLGDLFDLLFDDAQDTRWIARLDEGSLQALAQLKGPVDAFFDDVMVNAEDAALRANRQALLKQLHEAMNRVADLSRLAV